MSYSSRAHIVPMTSGQEGCDGTWVESLTSPDHQKVCTICAADRNPIYELLSISQTEKTLLSFIW